MPFAERSFGRRYLVHWDDGLYHVMLGRDHIGFHKTAEGASALAHQHAVRVSVPRWTSLYSVVFTDRGDEHPRSE